MELNSAKKLNIGCGVDIKKGWINLDSIRIPGVDIVHDIEKLPLPFDDGEFDEILCQDVLEHVDYIPVLKDLHRILKKGGVLRIRTPHFTSKNNFVDPTHRRMFSVDTWDFFVASKAASKHIEKERAYYFDFTFEKKSCCCITFEKNSRLFFYNRFAQWLFNTSSRMQSFYESTAFSRLFPAENILITLIK